ncbi:MAG: hypothetical protein Q7S20_10160 [Gemmatimonadaceae bacterium]|nr:hypothetical protein [Gemmatimonadaceae bacterium]
MVPECLVQNLRERARLDIEESKTVRLGKMASEVRLFAILPCECYGVRILPILAHDRVDGGGRIVPRPEHRTHFPTTQHGGKTRR